MRVQGRTYAPGGVKDELADAIREFNQFVAKDERVEVVAMPFRDGVSIVQRKCAPVLEASVKGWSWLHSDESVLRLQMRLREDSQVVQEASGLGSSFSRWTWLVMWVWDLELSMSLTVPDRSSGRMGS